VKDFFQALGLGTPFIFAAATYGFFLWLDRNASAPASKAISSWLKGQSYSGIDVKGAVISAFDRLYSSPLLGLKAFFRSAVISSIVLFAHNWFMVFVYSSIGEHLSIKRMLIPEIPDMIFFILIILFDYISLFPIRRCLSFAGDRPFLALSLAVVVGGCVVMGAFLTISLAIIGYNLGIEYIGKISFTQTIESSSLEFVILMFAPVFFIHLWLPLFLIGALGVRVIYLFFSVVNWAQWFLRGGYQRPIRAVGMGAAIFIFAGTAMVRAFPHIEASWGLPSGRGFNIDVAEFPLKVDKLEAARTPNGLMIGGDILNAGKTPHKVPRLRVALRDAAEREVQIEIVDPPLPLLAPGEIVHFETQIQHPDSAAIGIRVTFTF
jgi:hypothetical protein